ncbi:MAG: hypothetical protein LBE80_06245, partial [Deltaproteobacteria bacterium]|nr:hypothetical protein [Deltaproteobacteria bacterium]
MQLHELINHIGNKYNVSNEYKSGMEILLRDLDDKNMTTAVGIFVKAALSGESAAQYVLSRLLSQGAGAEKYQDKVLEYLKKAADGGILEAQYDYAIAHIFGGHNI